MPAASFQKFQSFVEHVAEKVHDLGADSLKVMLTNSAPLNTNTIKGNLTEISAGNGYAAGGTVTAQSASAQTAGVYKLTLGDVTFTAAGGSIGPFRYAVLYNDTPSSPLDPLIGFFDYGAAITLLDGDSFVVDFDATNGVLTIT